MTRTVEPPTVVPKLCPPTMTLAEAIETYKNSGPESVSPALREVINTLIDTNTKTEFNNDSYLDALYLSDVMFSRTQHTVRLLTGPSAGEFLQTLEESFVAMLERLRINKGFARMVLLAPKMPETLATLVQRYSDVFQVILAHAAKPVKHFMVCDSMMARLEEFHAPLLQTSDATQIKARVFFSEPTKATVFEQHFDTLWQMLQGKRDCHRPKP